MRETPAAGQFSASSFGVNVSAANVQVQVTLNSTSTQTITFDYATSDNTAQAGTDYVANSGTLTFPANTLSQTFTVTLMSNPMPMPPGVSFTVTLSNPTNATLGSQTTSSVNISTFSATTTTVSASASTITSGQSVNLTATVISTDQGIPQGDVIWSDNGTPLMTTSLNASGVATFQASGLWVGSHSLTAAYQGSMTFDTSSDATTVTVTPQPPTATNDSYSVLHDQVLSPAASGVLNNDSDPDQQPLTAVLVTGPAHGNLSLQSNGDFTYTPTAGYYGTDTFQYKASNGSLTSNTATVTITVTDQAPVANADSYTTTQEQPLSTTATGVLNNDTDADGDTPTAVLVSGPAHGTLSLQSNGDFTYTPASGYFGSDSFVYAAWDGARSSNNATVSLTVEGVPPTAQDDTYMLVHDRTLTVPASGVLANDSALNNATLSAVLVNGPAHGTLTLNADGSFVYEPDADYAGWDSFTYKAEAVGLLSDAATVSLTITNLDPQPGSPSYTLLHDGYLTVSTNDGVVAQSSDPDNDPLTATVSSNPAHGTLTLFLDGSFLYNPDAGFEGQDWFAFTLSDGVASVGGTATINVTNQTPVAVSDAYAVVHDQVLNADDSGPGKESLLDNDTDGDGDSLHVSAVNGSTTGVGTAITLTSGGVLTVNAGGTFLYTPPANFTGSDSFTYTASDGIATNTATVTIVVTSQGILAYDDLYATAQGQTLTASGSGPVSASLLANDFNTAGSSMTVSAVNGASAAVGASITLASGATLTVSANGSFTCTPATGFTGSDQFTYTVTDGTASASATARIDVVANLLIAQDDSYTLLHDQTLSAAGSGSGPHSLLANDSNTAGNTMTVSAINGDPAAVGTAITLPSGASLTANANGSFTYQPVSGSVGVDWFVYTVSVGTVSTVATANIQITNQTPVASADSYTTAANQTLTISTGSGLSFLLDNDSDPDSDPLSIVAVNGNAAAVGAAITLASGATLTANADGTMTYVPATNYTGGDAFTYMISDGAAQATSTVTITIPNQQLPGLQANPDSYDVGHDQMLTVGGMGVLYNDSSPSGTTLQAVVISGPSHGTVQFNSDGSFVYTPDAEFLGLDTFVYGASAVGFAAVAFAPVKIQVINVDHIWVGESTDDNKWSTKENWDVGSKPLAGDKVIMRNPTGMQTDSVADIGSIMAVTIEASYNLTITVPNNLTITSKLTQAGGTIAIEPGNTLTTRVDDMVDGRVEGGGTLRIQANMNISSSGIDASILVIEAGAKLNIQNLIFINGSTLTNHGTINWTGGTITTTLTTVVNNHGIFSIACDATMGAPGSAGSFFNFGVIQKVAGQPPLPGQVVPPRTVLNVNFLQPLVAGALPAQLPVNTVSAGMLDIAGALGELNATYNVVAGATLRFTGTTIWGPGTSFGGQGEVSLFGATITIPANVIVTSTAPVDFPGGTLDGPGHFVSNGSFTWRGGTIGVNDVEVIVNGPMHITGNQPVGMVNGSLTLYGDTTWDATARLELGNSSIYNYGTFNVLNGQTMQGIGQGFFTNGDDGLGHQGVFQKLAGSGPTVFDDVFFENAGGDFELGGETLELKQGGAQTGGTMSLDSGVLVIRMGRAFTVSGGTLTLTNLGRVDGMLIIDDGGRLSGPGMVNGNLTVKDGGVLDLEQGVGILKVQGNFIQELGGTTKVLITGGGANQFSQVQVVGTATVAGAVKATPAVGFGPMQGFSIPWLEAARRRGIASWNGQQWTYTFQTW